MMLGMIDTNKIFSHPQFNQFDVNTLASQLADTRSCYWHRDITRTLHSPTMIASDFEISEIAPQGLIINQPGTYHFNQDIIWNPQQSGAAITIVCSQVELDLHQFCLQINEPQGSAERIQSIGILVLPLASDTNNALEQILIQRGQIIGASISGIYATQVSGLTCSYLKMTDGSLIDPFFASTAVAGIQCLKCSNVTIEKCQITDMTRTAPALAGIQIMDSSTIQISQCQVDGLLNKDGGVEGISLLLCLGAKLDACLVNHLTTQFMNQITTVGHTCIGFIFTLTLKTEMNQCAARHITGCCDDAHGASIFVSADVTVNQFEAEDILDGVCINQTGAKATGMEIYGCNVQISNSNVQQIRAIRPQDLQSAGFSCWGAGISLTNCAAKQVSVLDENQIPDTTFGYGVGFGWAPDPRPIFKDINAVLVEYNDCCAEYCQVGFDTWKHQYSNWFDCTCISCEIRKKVEPIDATRILSMDCCSESPTDMPYFQKIYNTVGNNSFHRFDIFDSVGVSFPPICPENSWSVPRVSLPGLFSIQPQFSSEWWYYVGWACDTEGQIFSVQFQLLRSGQYPTTSITGSLVGIGWKDSDCSSNYLFAQSFGLGASLSGPISGLKKSLIIPNAQDHYFTAKFENLVEIVDPTNLDKSLFDDTNRQKPTHNIVYVGGAAMGQSGSLYQLKGEGTGYSSRTIANTENINNSMTYSVLIDMKDRCGCKMEGLSGYVGTNMFDSTTRSESSITANFSTSYECAQPSLQITGGHIVLDGMVHQLVAGNLWMDRQMVTGQKETDTYVSVKTVEDFKAKLNSTTNVGKSLYRGNWIGITLDSNLSIVLAVFWPQSDPQWIVGTQVNVPPENGFGNLYISSENTRTEADGGLYLRPKMKSDQTDTEWDFDINILTPNDPEHSPHWCSDFSHQTYATALKIDFSERVRHYGLPACMYLYAVTDNCENKLIFSGGQFFEGAACVYQQLESNNVPEQLIGHAFIEEMGYN